MESNYIESKMTEALSIAKNAWEKSNMPRIYPDYDNKDTGKIALAILAVKIFDELK
ncbi:MAG: hypothetical protein HYW78_04365 [Parcubacteria group bacterium]|nr:hypothetical protein [Parcubacteria group bacterium]